MKLMEILDANKSDGKLAMKNPPAPDKCKEISMWMERAIQIWS